MAASYAPSGLCCGRRRAQQCAIQRAVPRCHPAAAAPRSLAAAAVQDEQLQQQEDVAASAAGAAVPVATAAAAGEGGDEEWQHLPRPRAQHQPRLSSKQRAALRSQADALAQAKALQRMQVGGRGVTLSVLHAAADSLAKHELLRVRLGEGCGLERRATARALGQLLDAEVVGQIGFTITLYRQRGLPRPDNLARAAGGSGSSSSGGSEGGDESSSSSSSSSSGGGHSQGSGLP